MDARSADNAPIDEETLSRCRPPRNGMRTPRVEAPPRYLDVAANSNERGRNMTASIRSTKSTSKQAAKKAPVRPGARADKVDEESALLAKIAEMPESDRTVGERLHAIIKASAPALSPRLWYGMPAYAKGGKVVCFFQSAQKFKTRYATFGFMHEANLDDGAMWPTAFALKKLTAAEEARIVALVKKAVS
jgi:uncharacterized protein YdhG (YjbR/CyaY superfamily)